MLIALERRGDVYWDFTDYGEAKEEFVFRLGEPVVSKSIGSDMKESQIMDKFLGKFRFLPEKLTGFDNWADVMKLSPEARGLIKTCKNMLIAVERRGDVYWDFTDFGVVTEEFVFRLGEPVTSKTWGYDVTSVFKLDGEVLRGEHDFGGFKTTSARYYEGDALVFEMTASGVTTKSYYLRESQIMDKFLGKFQFLPERMTGFDKWADVMKLSPEARGLIKTCKNMLIAVERRGDVYWDFTDFGVAKEEFVFRLGEPTMSKTWGYDVKSVFKLDGDVLRGEHDLGGFKTTSARYYEGDTLVFPEKLMEKFFGRFKYLPEKTTGFDQYADAMSCVCAKTVARQQAAEKRAGLVKNSKDVVTELQQRGDVIWDLADYGAAKEEFVFRLGEPVMTKDLGLRRESESTA
nr:hypothetical protein BaRGS_013251 [Batillaria attramentaria]